MGSYNRMVEIRWAVFWIVFWIYQNSLSVVTPPLTPSQLVWSFYSQLKKNAQFCLLRIMT